MLMLPGEIERAARDMSGAVDFLRGLVLDGDETAETQAAVTHLPDHDVPGIVHRDAAHRFQ